MINSNKKMARIKPKLTVTRARLAYKNVMDCLPRLHVSPTPAACHTPHSAGAGRVARGTQPPATPSSVARHSLVKRDPWSKK